MSPAADSPLTAEAILVATEDVLRRLGPAKATVVDIARTLGVSHGSVYRHFPTKTALREAVTRRWLDQVHQGLADIAAGVPTPGSDTAEPTPNPAPDPDHEPASAPDRLRLWLTELFAAKRRKVLADPELFATYSVLVSEHSDAIADHLAGLVRQLTKIISAGQAAGDFRVPDPETSARAVFDATVRFHDPAHAADWSDPDIDDQFRAVRDLVLGGLIAR